MSPFLQLWTETNLVSGTLCLLVFRIQGDGQSPETVILSVIHHRLNPLDSAKGDRFKAGSMVGKLGVQSKGRIAEYVPL
jgi:hypothetical protein